MVAVALGIACVFVCLLLVYLFLLQRQLRRINRQMAKRMDEDTNQLVSVELVSGELDTLVEKINRAFEQQQALREDSARKEKEFRALIASISHDLRTPLTVIKGYLELLSQSDVSPENQEKLCVAQRHAAGLGDLIDRFFEYSCLVTLERQPAPSRLDIVQMVTEQLAAAVPLFEARGLSVALSLEGPVYVYADPEDVNRIIQNLVRNCVSHAVGTIAVDIVEDDAVALTFSNPVGNTESMEVERLFDRFYTGDPSRGTSSGLGLSIVQFLARQNGGSVLAGLAGDVLAITVVLPSIKIE